MATWIVTVITDLAIGIAVSIMIVIAVFALDGVEA